MKSLIAAVSLIMVLGFPSSILAGGHFTCEAQNSAVTKSIYVHVELQDLLNLPGYPGEFFRYATPLAPTEGYDHAAMYYLDIPQNTEGFKVVAVFESTKMQNREMRGKLTVIDVRAKPHGNIYNVICTKGVYSF